MRAGVRVCLAVALCVTWLAQAGGAAGAASSPPEVVAAAAIVMDASSGAVLYAKNADAPRAPASLTKLATALTAIDLAPPDSRLQVIPADLVGEASAGLRPGMELTLESALYGLLLASGNDAAMTIARNVSALPGDTPEMSVARFVRQMNIVAERLGLEHTTFRNPHGLDEPGHVTTARDLAVLMRAVLQRPELRRILASPTYSDGQIAVETTNRLLGQYAGLIGGKTGITEAAGYSLIEAAERDGNTVIVVVLGSTREAWYRDAVQLLDYGFARVAAGDVGEESPATALPLTAPNGAPAIAPEARALVLQVPAPDPRAQQAWFWPLSAATAVVAFGVVLTGFPVLTAVAVSRRRRARPERAREALPPGGRHRFHGSPAPRALRSERTHAAVPPRPARRHDAAIIAFDPAVAVAQRAVRAGRRGEVALAEAGFCEALRVNPALDLTRLPEFWTMSPTGVVAAARAYRRVGRVRDARTLLTVAQISFGDVPAIREALASLPRQQWDATTVSVLPSSRLGRS